MKMKHIVTAAALTTLPFIGSAFAVPAVSLHSSNVGIDSISVAYDAGTNTFTITEDWDATGPGVLHFTGFTAADKDTVYTIRKIINNNSGVDWTRMALELLDPLDNVNDDGADPLPYPGHVPAGFSTSNDGDGLHFNQGSPNNPARTSTAFASWIADELTDVRDFIDFYNGTLIDGGSDNYMQIAIRVNSNYGSDNFLLMQRPNESSVPEPGVLGLLGLGLLGLGYMRRRKV